MAIEGSRRCYYAYFKNGRPTRSQLIDAFERIDVKLFRECNFTPEFKPNVLSKIANLSRWKVCEVECAPYYLPKKKKPVLKKLNVVKSEHEKKLEELERLQSEMQKLSNECKGA
jgi:hypothetical protein